jgi:ADP-ribosylglycohydrolase
LCEEFNEIACSSFKRKEPPEIVGSGYLAKSLESALWAFSRSSDFRDGCLLAVNLGNEADTTKWRDATLKSLTHTLERIRSLCKAFLAGQIT